MMISTVVLMSLRYRKLLAPSRYAAKSPYRNLCLTPHSTYSTLKLSLGDLHALRAGASVRAITAMYEIHAGTHSTASNLPANQRDVRRQHYEHLAVCLGLMQ